ncbi:MAG: protein kinase [Acidobacteria bacterium]|nr:protein kinase [Acidobacteriota bacterium]
MKLGTILENKYRLEKLVDKNILGGLYLATNIKSKTSQKKVLINLLPFDSQTCIKNNYFDKYFIELNQTSHYWKYTRSYPGIFISNFGEVRGEKAYLVLEYVDSPSLEKIITEKGRFSSKETIKIALQVCSSITKANSLGVIYRNINPATIMLDLQNNLNTYPLDFDIDINKLYSTKEFELLCQTLAVNNSQVSKQIELTEGSLNFMTPEQAQGLEEIYPQAEVYTIGILLYLMLSGEFPFTGKTATSLAIACICHLPKPLTTYPDINHELDNIVQCALAKDARQRHQSVLALANELIALLPKTTASATKTTKTVSNINLTAIAPNHKDLQLFYSTTTEEKQASFLQQIISFFSGLLRK